MSEREELIETKEGLTVETATERYSDVGLKFASYYKYTFKFRGTAPDGMVIIAEYGGNKDDIYRYNVCANDEQPMGDLEDCSWSRVYFYRDSKQVFSREEE